MDSLSNKVTIEFSNLAADIPAVLEPYEALLNIVADFSVTVDTNLVYDEQLFPVVEFAIESHRWARQLVVKNDFVFASIEAQGPLLWIKRSQHSWIVGSDICNSRSPAVTFDDIKKGINDFYKKLNVEVKKRFTYDLNSLEDWRRT